MIYLDSSIMIARFLEEAGSSKAEEIWAREDDFVASALTVAESVVALRRSALGKKGRFDEQALRTALARLEDDLLRVSVS